MCVRYFNNIRLIDISGHTADDDVTRVEQTVVEYSADDDVTRVEQTVVEHSADDDVTRVEQTVVEHRAAAALRTLIEPNEARKLAIMKDIRSDENMLRGPLGSGVTGRRQGRRDVVVMTSRYLYPLCLNKHSDSKQSSCRTVYATCFTCTIFLKTMIKRILGLMVTSSLMI